MEDDDDSSFKKRFRDDEQDLDESAEDKKNRGNYRCSKCNLPKKGHVCPYQPRFKRRDQQVEAYHDVGIQVELDPDMVVRALPLDKQGLPESYLVSRNIFFSSHPFPDSK